jgi:hypothetical protein
MKLLKPFQIDFNQDLFALLVKGGYQNIDIGA